jgi:hypothetical protein
MVSSIAAERPTISAAPWDDVLDEELVAVLKRRQPKPMLGKRPAVIAVDLYDLVYDGGPRPVVELMEQYPASCGEFAWAALPATIELFATARSLHVPIVHVNYDNRPETDRQGTFIRRTASAGNPIWIFTLLSGSCSPLRVNW